MKVWYALRKAAWNATYGRKVSWLGSAGHHEQTNVQCDKMDGTVVLRQMNSLLCNAIGFKHNAHNLSANFQALKPFLQKP